MKSIPGFRFDARTAGSATQRSRTSRAPTLKMPLVDATTHRRKKHVALSEAQLRSGINEGCPAMSERPGGYRTLRLVPREGDPDPESSVWWPVLHPAAPSEESKSWLTESLGSSEPKGTFPSSAGGLKPYTTLDE